MSNDSALLDREYDSQKDLVVGISGITIFAFFISAAISLLLVFTGYTEERDGLIKLANLIGVTVEQFSLVGSIISFPIGLFGLYSLYLVASGKNQSNLK